MSGVHVFTSFTYSYLSRARVLAKSVRRRHPDWTLWAVLVDRPPPGFDDRLWEGEFDHVLDAADLFPGVWRQWIFKHHIVEACTAVKGHALLHLLSLGAEKVIYLDPDIAVFHDLGDLVSKLDTHSIVLTPHQLDPNLAESEIADNELTSMKYGIYNLGFLAVRNDGNAVRMAKWWATRLYHACYDDVTNGIFTDQKYFDIVPGLFGGVHVERDPGYNVASWNLSRRDIEISPGGEILVNGSRLRFYHFTKINSDGDSMTERYAGTNLAVYEVWNWYKRELRGMELETIPNRYWRYGQFEDGTAIPRAARLVWRTRPELMACFPDPFASGPDSYQSWCDRRETARRDGDDEPALPADNARSIEGARGDAVAAVVHVFYPELLAEIRDLLTAYTGPLKLFVTTTRDKADAVGVALRGFSHPYEVGIFENRGRDVLPFLLTLPRLMAEGFDFILKLHTKKSTHRRDGGRWRRELLTGLAEPFELQWTIGRLQRRPDVGMVAPEGHVLKLSAYWGSNEARTRVLAQRMGVAQAGGEPEAFVAGSMFVARTAALAPIASLRLSPEAFEPESGQTDGTLAHAVERAFAYSAAAAGLRVAAKPALALGSGDDLALVANETYRFAPRSDIAA
ncbi:rhamnan synthesis protein F [Roseiarcus fermentans]|uniref:Rhamnan synthesis protein F n=1 Tax=Roseiarcus fermentans TaxID=1473586 RepID=A0A366ERS1_9HYPH|nr:rhamnan synthesis F family protein [Roseiarcus fermentans]RBP04636.1 rhamnan synthesis protein F [Roseiarcus fermentans]